MPPGPRSPRRSPALLRLLITFLPLLLSLPETSRAAVLVEVRVTPAGVVMAPEQFRQFFATAVFDDGSTQDITAVAEWTTGDSRIARVSQLHGSRGLVESRDPGTVEIRAALEHGGNKTKGFVLLTVDAGPVVAITTRPSSKNLDVGIPTQFQARATYANGYVANLNEGVQWSSSHPAVASVSADGLVNPLQPTNQGQVVIRARHVATGLQNSNADGATRIFPAITHIQFDEELLARGQPEIVLGVGMISEAPVYAHRVDGTRSDITRDVEFTVSGPASVIEVYDDGESDDFEAGTVEARSSGFVFLQATDPSRGLATTQSILIVVSGFLESLEVTPDPFTTSVGDQRTAKVIGHLSTGQTTPDLRKVVHWSTDHPSIAIVGADSETDSANVGKVTGISAGDTILRVTEPNTGVTASVPVTVRGAFTEVEIDAEEIVLGVGMMLPLRADGIRSDDSTSNVTDDVLWQVSPAGLATVDPEGILLDGVLTHGVLQTLASGTGTVRALLNAGTPDEVASPSVPLRVEGTLVALHVKPDNFRVIRDLRRKASAEGELSTGATTSNLTAVVDWSVADTSVALVGNGDPIPSPEDPLDRGEVLGVETGVTTLTAVEPISGIASTQVDNLRVQGDVVSVEVDEPNGGIVQVGTPGEYKARATFTDGTTGVISDRCEWTIDDPSVATVDNELPGKGFVTGIVIGRRTVIRVDCSGISASGMVEVAGAVVRLEIDPETFTGKALRDRRFRAAADYEGGARGDATELVAWSSTNPTVATVDNQDDKGRVRFLSDGETFIFAVAPSGHVAIATVTVTGGVTHIRVVPNSKSIRGSTGRKLKAIAELSDGDQTIATNSVTWTSSDEEIARMSDREGEEGIVLGGTKLGTATITASLPTGASGTSEITVNSLLQSITMRPDRRIVDMGKHRQVSARGHYADGNKSITRYVEFVSDDPGIAEVQSFGPKPGRVIAVSPGTTTIRAVDPISGIESSNRTIIEVVEPDE